MKFLLIVSLGVLTSITACAPSPEIVATAMAQTEAALPTHTPSPLPTATFTFTPEPPTSTPTLTPTSTPDLQVITTDPEDIVCTKRDLPGAGDYVQVPPQSRYYGHRLHNTNESILVSGGGAQNRATLEEYIYRTRRIDGWWVDYKRTNSSYSGYTFIQCAVVKFQTIEGAQLAVQEYNDAEIYSEYEFEYLENPDQSIGDVSVGIANTYFSDLIVYEVDFSYRNYRVTIIGYGEANLDDLYYVGERILNKLKNEPLSAP